MPALDPTPATPTTLSPPIVTGLLRKELAFRGLIYTDSMGMQGVTNMHCAGRSRRARHPRRQRRRPALAGRRRGVRGHRGAVESGRIPAAQVDASVERILRAKARVGLHKIRVVDARRDCRRRRHARESGRGRQRQPAVDHAGQGRAQSGAAAACRATRRCCTCRCSTIRRAGGSRRRAGRSSRSCASAGRT